MWERRERKPGPDRFGQLALLLAGAGAMAALFAFGVIG